MTILKQHRHEFYGLLAFVALALIAALVVASYLQVFTPWTRVTVKADRAGLLLQRDSDVTMRDVRIGKVSAVEPDGPRGAAVTILIDPVQTPQIPANVTGQIIAPTLFGPKYVDLLAPPRPTARRISTGDVLARPPVQVEVNDVFQNVIGLLQSVEPAKLNSALGALSTTLQGRGDDLGRYLVRLNRYLERLNPSLPALQNDLRRLPPVIDGFNGVAPDLLKVLDNFSVTSDTVVAEQPALDALIADLGRFAPRAQSFLEQNEDGLVESLDVLKPTTALLARYSPIFPCTFASANTLRKVTEPSFGGVVPGLRTITAFGPGQEPYKFPQNLPTLGVDAPGCYGGAPRPGTIPRHVFFDDGSPRLDTRDNPPTLGDTPLAVLLFGPLAPQIPLADALTGTARSLGAGIGGPR